MASHKRIEIGNGVTIESGVYIYDHDHDGKGGYIAKPITIGEGTWIGVGCIILKDVNIAKNCVVAAGSVVTKDIKENTVLIQKRLNLNMEKEKNNWAYDY